MELIFVIFTLHWHLIEVHNLLCEACELDRENVNVVLFSDGQNIWIFITITAILAAQIFLHTILGSILVCHKCSTLIDYAKWMGRMEKDKTVLVVYSVGTWVKTAPTYTQYIFHHKLPT